MDFTSVLLPYYFRITSVLLPYFTSVLLPYYFCITTILLPYYSNITPISLPYHSEVYWTVTLHSDTVENFRLGGNIISAYLDMPVLSACNAAAITESVKNTLSLHDIPLKKLVGIGTDNASVMVGVNNGVVAQLRKHVPNLVLVHCLCHSLQLAVSAASSETLPRNLEYLISETYNWFSRSSGRQLAYHQLYALLNDGDNPLHMVQACETRWLSIEPAVTRIVDQWLKLRTHFDLARQAEKCYLTDTLSNM
jgi:hypothetical protein